MAKIDEYKKTIEQIAKDYKLIMLIYFGSYKTVYYNKNSDIDIAFLSDIDLSTNQLEDMYKDMMIFHMKGDIDLLNLKTCEPLIAFNAVKDMHILYESEEGIAENYRNYYIKKFYENKSKIEERIKMGL